MQIDGDLIEVVEPIKINRELTKRSLTNQLRMKELSVKHTGSLIGGMKSMIRMQRISNMRDTLHKYLNVWDRMYALDVKVLFMDNITPKQLRI